MTDNLSRTENEIPLQESAEVKISIDETMPLNDISRLSSKPAADAGTKKLTSVRKRVTPSERTTSLDASSLDADHSLGTDRTIRIEEEDIKHVFNHSAKYESAKDSDGGKKKVSLFEDSAAFLGETGRLARTFFDKRRNVDEIIEASAHARTKIRKEVETDPSGTVMNLASVNDTYDILSLFDEGGQGCISSAIDRTLNRLVAIKSLKKEFAHDENVRNNFIAEAKVTAQLDHPSVVPIYDLSKDKDDNLFLAMKMINGQNFRDYLDQICTHYKLNGIGAYDEHKSLLNRLDIFLRICEAMEYAHSRNVMHCDLKPENIMIGEYHETYIMDWGIARLINEPGYDPATWKRPKQISGTPRFLSPEAINGEHCDQRADIYTLGLILFEIVTLKPAFTGNTSMEVMSKIRDNDMERLDHRFHYKIDTDLKAIIWKATAYDRETRYQTVPELAEDIRRYVNGSEVSANPDNFSAKVVRWTGKHRKGTLIFTFFLLFLAASGMAWSLYEKMNQIIVNKIRDTAVTEVHAKASSAAYDINRQVSRLEQALESISWETILLLEAKVPNTGGTRFYPYTAFQGGVDSPSSSVYSEVYGTKIDFENFSYQIALDGDAEAAMDDLQYLGPLKDRLLRFILTSRLDTIMDDYNVQALKTEAIRQGMPVYWVYITFTNGMQICFPANDQYALDYDGRTRDWYKEAENSRWKQVWGKPYYDTGSFKKMVITSSMAMIDSKDKMYGVAALDMSINHIIEMMKMFGNSPELVIDKYIIGKHGEIIASTSDDFWDSITTDDNDNLTLPKFTDSRLAHEFVTKKFGVTIRKEGAEEVLYSYSEIPTLGWVYVEKILFTQAINKVMEENAARKKKNNTAASAN